MPSYRCYTLDVFEAGSGLIPHLSCKRKRVETYGGEVLRMYANRGVVKPFEVIGRWTKGKN